MGELIVGRPALQVKAAVSLPLDMVSVMSLLYRAVPGSGLDPWLISTRRGLPGHLQHDLDLLHGFSGRLLYFMEEPIMRFEPLRQDRLEATIDDLIGYLESLPSVAYREMVERALGRVHQDLGTGLAAPHGNDEFEWRRFIEPGITTANGDEVLQLVLDSDLLKSRTLRLIRGIWDHAYETEYERNRERMAEAGRIAQAASAKGLTTAFGELTGNRVPSTLAAGLGKAARVTFIPSMHLGSFMSFVLYPPDVIIFFSAENVLRGDIAPVEVEINGNGHHRAAFDGRPAVSAEGVLEGTDLLEALRALSDANRLRILDLLGSGELYANEIVGRLGIAQSAVSRHLSQLERAGLVAVNPRGGMKYYAIDANRLSAVAETLRTRAANATAIAGTSVAN
ncbi:MAG TPA: metalloregulator ArsR/SmtB family transcription factor [Thermomicrobiales bacterium]|nr:metalloregulator ArsR/SmtB family transcription factor [Thermomicrobiales bacterium]